MIFSNYFEINKIFFTTGYLQQVGFFSSSFGNGAGSFPIGKIWFLVLTVFTLAVWSKLGIFAPLFKEEKIVHVFGIGTGSL